MSIQLLGQRHSQAARRDYVFTGRLTPARSLVAPVFRKSVKCFLSIVTLSALCGYCAVPARSVIERHLDHSVEVYGQYAAIRLPIDKGVRIWNPTAIRVNYRGEIFAL